MNQRLDQYLVAQGIVASRSQSESYIKLGRVRVNGRVVAKPGIMVSSADQISADVADQYVSRAALKLKSVSEALKLNFKGKTVLDVGSSTGGFTQFALENGAKRVIAVDVGTGQLHPLLRGNPQIDLHEQTDIREFKTDEVIDMVLADVSFISLREILPSIIGLVTVETDLVMMVKPQFEASLSGQKHKGVIKNERIRREILRDFEAWAKARVLIIAKRDSTVYGAKGNLERFYLLRKTTA